MAMIVRGSNPTALINPARNAIWSVDKNQPVDSMMTMEQVIEQRLGKERALANIISLFGITALFLAGLGIYGVTAYSVRQRTREIGIRVALGAKIGHVLLLVVRQSLIFILIGIVAGLVGAVLLSRTVSGLLYGVRPLDPLTYVLASVILIMISVAAIIIPARRASRVDPAIALRQE
jgi:ABC-type antimicrobial peptide transport system permease subunit